MASRKGGGGGRGAYDDDWYDDGADHDDWDDEDDESYDAYDRGGGGAVVKVWVSAWTRGVGNEMRAPRAVHFRCDGPVSRLEHADACPLRAVYCIGVTQHAPLHLSIARRRG